MEDSTRETLGNLFRFLQKQGDISSIELIMLSDTLEEKDIWMTSSEVALMLKISIRSVIRYTNEGIFKRYKLGNICRYLKYEILEAMGVTRERL